MKSFWDVYKEIKSILPNDSIFFAEIKELSKYGWNLNTYVGIMKLYKNENNASLELEALVNHLQ